MKHLKNHQNLFQDGACKLDWSSTHLRWFRGSRYPQSQTLRLLFKGLVPSEFRNDLLAGLKRLQIGFERPKRSQKGVKKPQNCLKTPEKRASNRRLLLLTLFILVLALLRPGPAQDEDQVTRLQHQVLGRVRHHEGQPIRHAVLALHKGLAEAILRSSEVQLLRRLQTSQRWRF